MIGTQLIEELVQSVALTHLVRGHKRVSLLVMAAPESGKTTITTAATAKHICRVALITGRSILKEVNDHPHTEFLLFNDLTAVRAMSPSAVNLLIVLLNQLTQDEHGMVGFAGKEVEHINRSIGILACIPFSTFTDHRARWKELGFVSRMVPFSYHYSAELIARIKNTIDSGTHPAQRQPHRKMPRMKRASTHVECCKAHTLIVRALADARAVTLQQLGIRLLQNYHCLIRAHALLFGRQETTEEDIAFLRAVDSYVSITECRRLIEDRRGTERRATDSPERPRRRPRPNHPTAPHKVTRHGN